MTTTPTTARIPPAAPPFPPEIQAALDRLMRGQPPLQLFTTLARDPRLFDKLFRGGLLDRGNLTLRQRELVIHRTCARCGSAYEFGVHAAAFAGRAGLDDVQLQALAHGGAEAACWSDGDRVLIRLCDALHATCTVDDVLWGELAAAFSPEALLELLLLAGYYRTVSYLTNALQLPLEAGAGFPAAAPG